MPADLSFFSYFTPIAAFLIVFVVLYAILKQTKVLGDNNGVILTLSLIVAVVFISTAGARRYVTTIIPAFAILIISLAFILILIGFSGDLNFMKKGIGIVFIIILGLVFLVSAYITFSSVISGYLPGQSFGQGIDPDSTQAFEWLYSSRVAGAILLIIVSVIVSWILVRKGK